ncbi:MAG: DUF3352 domain-containing protein [Solirubrobacteraceae bacterium]
METKRRTHQRTLAGLLGAAATALAIAACGSSHHATGTSADPASVIPAQSSVYLDVALRPSGALARYARADEKTLTGSAEPLGALVEELSAAAGLPTIRYASEVKRWVGPHAGLFITSLTALEGLEGALGASLGEGFSLPSLLRAATKSLLAGRGVDGALVLDTSDLGGARSFLAKLARRDGARKQSFDGVSYELDSAGGASGIVGRFVVIGTESGLKSVIETQRGGSPLASASTYSKLAGGGGASNALLRLYLDAEPIATTASGVSKSSRPSAGAASDSRPGAGASLLSLLPGEPHAAFLALTPQSRALRLEARLLSASGVVASRGAAEAAEGAKLLGALPASSWLALGAGGVGSHVDSYAGALGSIASLAGKSLLANFGGPALEGLAKRFEASRSKLEAIFAGRAKAAAVFAGGRGLLELEAGIVLEMRSHTDAAAAVNGLAALMEAGGGAVTAASLTGAEAAESIRLSGLPFVLDVGTSGTRVALGLGPGSVEAALAPPQGTLSEGPLYGEARKALGGEQPLALLDFPTLLAFLEGLGLTESGSLAGAARYLRPLGELAGGLSAPEGAVERLKLVLPLAG